MTDNTTAQDINTPDEDGNYPNTVVPSWPGPVTDEHYTVIAENGMKQVADLANHFTTADLAFWQILTARLGRTPTYADLEAIEDHIKRQQTPPYDIPRVLGNALAVYYPSY